MIRFARPMAAVLACWSLGGCGHFWGSSMTASKFGPMWVTNEKDEPADLVSIITDGASHFPGGADGGTVSGAERTFNEALSDALKAFYRSGPAEQLHERRDRIQDRLMWESRKSCEAYKTALLHKQADVNFNYGAISVLFGAGGALATASTTARSFAALSGSAAGIRAEYNKDFFADSAASVISKSIDKRRDDIEQRLLKARKDIPIKVYSLESALSDIVVFHGACSLAAGLQYADAAVSSVGGKNNTWGLDVLRAEIANPLAVSPADAASGAKK